MERGQSKLIEGLNSIEIDALINLYYNQEGSNQGFNSSIDEETLTTLIDKNLISTKLGEDENLISLTESGLTLCGRVMKYRIDAKEELFKEKIKSIPERAIATIVNRVIWKDEARKESGIVDPITKPYALDETLWYERVLLKDTKIQKTLDNFYNILVEVDFLKNIQGQKWCSIEVEEYLKNKYRSTMDLTWQEEESLKYYYFFHVYAQDQKSLINFSGEGEEYRSMFLGDNTSPSEYWYSSNRSNPRTFLSNLDLTEKRVITFLEEMQSIDIVNERSYPLSSFSFFNEEEKIFVVRDIKKYMGFIANKFLSPVVESILEK
jgi:hypothetical protein